MSDRAVQAMLPLGVEELDAEPADGGDAMAIPLSAAEEEPLAAGVEDDASPPAPSDLIEPGRALVISDFVPPEVSAGERLIRLAYRLGIPGSALAAPFRKHPAPRLLATVENPLPGDPVAGTALRAGHFLVHGVKTPIAHLDCSPVARLTPPLERVVHGFTWLADLEACAPRQQCTQTAERVLAAWLEANPKPGKGAAWRVGHAGQRLLGWLVHAPLLLGGNDKRLRARTLAAAVETARWLDRNVSKADDRLAEVAGWCGIVAAGLLLPEGKPRRLFGEAGLVRALGELVGDDGGVLSRSPLDQMEAIALLTRLTACYRATRRDPPQAIDAMLRMLVPPLLAMIHADSALGSWQGSSAVGEDRLRALIAASGVRTRPLKDARQWGYQRVTARTRDAAARRRSAAARPAQPPRLRLDPGLRVLARAEPDRGQLRRRGDRRRAGPGAHRAGPARHRRAFDAGARRCQFHRGADQRQAGQRRDRSRGRPPRWPKPASRRRRGSRRATTAMPRASAWSIAAS